MEKLILAEEEYQQEDVEFHRRIAQASRNRVTSTLVPVIHSSSSLNIDLTHNELRENTVRYHRALAEALRRRDPLGARYAMVQHLAENRRYILAPGPGDK